MDVMIAAFERCNGTQRFEFVERIAESDHQKKCRIKCKACKSVFETWQIDEIRRGRKDKITCPDCGASSDGSEVFSKTAKAEMAVDLYRLGLMQTEIAEMVGCSVSDVGVVVKKFGVVDKSRKCRGGLIANAKRSKEAESRIEKILTDNGFIYCGGYSSKNGSVEVGCKTCGERFTRTVAFIQHGNLTCPSCAKAEKEEAQKQERLLAEQERERKRQERILLPKVKRYEKTHEAFLDRIGNCCICGKEYTVRDYVKSAGLKYASDGGVCSVECKREKERRIKRSHRTPSNHRHRAMMHGVDYEPGITLKKLVMRNGLRCALCGELCDWNDHTWSKYSGPKHPTIDHIIPISKGGPHTWANVQVACAMCNSLKSDNVQECVKGGA